MLEYHGHDNRDPVLDGIDDRDVRFDDARAPEFTETPADGRGRETDALADGGVTQQVVLLDDLEDGVVEGVERHDFGTCTIRA